MFWGCFYGHTKGPGFFWEKDWGLINCAHTVPIIYGYIEMIRREDIYLVLMQDLVLGYAAGDTRQDLRGIIVIFWPHFSPDLNPIERGVAYHEKPSSRSFP
jgi:transposase